MNKLKLKNILKEDITDTGKDYTIFSIKLPNGDYNEMYAFLSIDIENKGNRTYLYTGKLSIMYQDKEADKKVLKNEDEYKLVADLQKWLNEFCSKIKVKGIKITTPKLNVGDVLF